MQRLLHSCVQRTHRHPVLPLSPQSILGPVLQSLRAVAPQLSGEDGRNATFAQHTINSLLHT